PTELGERIATYSVQMFYEIPQGYFVEGLVRDELVVTDLGLWWRIRTMARPGWNPRAFIPGCSSPVTRPSSNPRGFIPWWTITTWLVKPRRRGRKDVEIHHVLHHDRPAILLVRARADTVDELTETVRSLLPKTCVVYEEQPRQT